MTEVIELHRPAALPSRCGTSARSSRAATRRRAGSRARSGRRCTASRSRWSGASASRSWARTARASRRSSACSRRCSSTTAAARTSSATTSSPTRARCAGSSTASRSRRASSRRCRAGENLALRRALLRHGAARDARSRSRRSSTKVGFPVDRRTEPMENLSRGMQQKVALARALLTSPVLLLLDEPTTGLDPRSKLEVQEFVREVRQTHDATILLCTHDLAEAEALADRVGILDRGELLFLETVPRDPRALRRRDARAGVLRRHRPRVRGRDGRGRRGPGGVRMTQLQQPRLRAELIGLGGVVERNVYLDPPLHLVGRRLHGLDDREHAHDRLHREGDRGDRRLDRRQPARPRSC